jgi:hypothetical protein
MKHAGTKSLSILDAIVSRLSSLTSTVVVLAAALAVAAGSAHAATLLTVSSYDMPNGDGNGGGGNYWDTTYSNCGVSNCTTDGLSGSSLSGGNGLLTDGVIPTVSYDSGAGIGAYVGWLQSPAITFHFGSTQSVNEVKLYVDNSLISGISAPGPVLINGTSYNDFAWAGVIGPETIDIVGLALSSSDIVVTLNSTNYWTFLSEAKFFCPSPGATPLPPAWPMMLIGLAGLGIVAWRRRRYENGALTIA